MKMQLTVTCVIVGLFWGLAPLASRAAVPDTTINDYVQHALRDDSRVDVSEITAITDNGIVILSGSVRSLAAKQYAILEAKKINGVLAVVDKVTVSSGDRPDTEIADAVRRRILNSTVVVSRGIEVACKQGVVSLSGTVNSYAEEQQAGLLASEVLGVKDVKNHITMKASSTRSDPEIKNDAVAALERDVYLTGMPITVTVHHAVVRLSGSVGNAYEKERAYGDVRWIANVKQVQNDLSVTWHQNHGARDQQMNFSDAELTSAVRKTLERDSRVDATDIAVVVPDGHVTLDGFVDSHYERDVAQQDAEGVVGVIRVTGKLFARVDKRADSEVQDDIHSYLTIDSVTGEYGLNASVADGAATLTGTVHTPHEKTHAYDVASRVRGVRRVINQIVISTQWKKDADIADSIRKRLKGDWETWRSADKIKVTVDVGIATLKGDLKSFYRRFKVGDIALHTVGVSEIDNRITVNGEEYPWDGYREK